VTYSAGSAATILNPTLGADLMPGAGWDFTAAGSNANSAALTLGAFGSGVQPSSGRALLGTFRFTASSTLLGDVAISAGDPNLGLGDVATYTSITNLDFARNIAPGTATISVVPVPEPAGVLAVTGLAITGWRALRRRNAKRCEPHRPCGTAG